MTRISTITGMVKRPYYNPNAVSGNVPKQPTLDYAALSSGELRLALIRRQLDILTTVHPDNTETSERRKAMTMIDNILHQGVHGLSSLTGSFWWGGEAGRIASEIKKAVKRQYPASYNHINSRVGGVHSAFELLSENPCNLQEIAQRMQGAPQSVIDAAYQTCLRDAQSNAADIRLKNEIRTALNTDLEKSSHSPLYEFLTPEQFTKINNADAVLGSKISTHRSFANVVSSTSGLERDNIRLWMRNGVMATNAQDERLGALSPEETILGLANYPNVEIRNGQPHIGFVFTLLSIVGVVSFIIAAGIVIIAIIQTLQKKEPTALQYLSSLTNIIGLGSGKDWAGAAGKILLPNGPTGGTGVTDCPTGFTKNETGVCVPIETTNDSSGLPAWALPVGAAAAAYLILK